MSPFSVPNRIFVCTSPTDMRAGIDRLAIKVTTELEADPTDGSLYVFVSRDARMIKMLRFEGYTWCLYHVKVTRGKFRWNVAQNSTTPVLEIERKQLALLLDGIELGVPIATKPFTATKVI